MTSLPREMALIFKQNLSTSNKINIGLQRLLGRILETFFQLGHRQDRLSSKAVCSWRQRSMTQSSKQQALQAESGLVPLFSYMYLSSWGLLACSQLILSLAALTSLNNNKELHTPFGDMVELLFFFTGLINISFLVPQDDLAQKQKLKDEKKALEQAKAKAAQKGPMGRCISHLRFLVTHCHRICSWDM